MHGTVLTREKPSRRRKTMFEGFIDGWEGGLVRGWVWDQSDPGRRIQVTLFVDNVICGICDASQPRPDLKAAGRGDGNYGFTIMMPHLAADGTALPRRIKVLSATPENWSIPFAPHTGAASVRRRRFALPSWRQIPATTHELVAILTGSDPFPKKVAVIDRLARRMPDAFSADYVLLAMEFLRVEMVAIAEPPATTLTARLRSWARQRTIRGQIRRLAALAEAAAATQRILKAPRQGGHETP